MQSAMMTRSRSTSVCLFNPIWCDEARHRSRGDGFVPRLESSLSTRLAQSQKVPTATTDPHDNTNSTNLELRFPLTGTPQKGSMSIFSPDLGGVIIPIFGNQSIGRTVRVGGANESPPRFRGHVQYLSLGNESFPSVSGEVSRGEKML